MAWFACFARMVADRGLRVDECTAETAKSTANGSEAGRLEELGLVCLLGLLLFVATAHQTWVLILPQLSWGPVSVPGALRK